MRAWRAKAAAKIGEFAGAEILLAEYQHRVLGESALDPGEIVIVKISEIDAERFGAERLAQGTQFRVSGHRRSPFC